MASFDSKKIVAAWKDYLDSVGGWRKLIATREPTQTGCGPIYEIGNPLERPNEDFAIADMRHFQIAEPHYHPEPNIEIYSVLEGEGVIVLGGEEIRVRPGSVVLIRPDTAHYAVAVHDFVMAVINTPPFHPDMYIPISESSTKYKFDKSQFKRFEARSII